MRSYEVTYIVDSTLDNNAIKDTAKKYQNTLTEGNAEIVAVDEIGLRQLAYPINRRNSGVYYCVEFKTDTPDLINRMELNMRRDDSILRFLTVSLNKFGVKYNADKRDGKIGTARKIVKEEIKEEKNSARRSKRREQKSRDKSVTRTSNAVKAEGKVAKDAPAPVKEAAPKKVEKDDLTKIEGIGPKIQEILYSSEMTTFQALSECQPQTIRKWLSAAGGRFASHNPETWPAQAKMAADGKWDELKKWQDELDGGKPAKAKAQEEE